MMVVSSLLVINSVQLETMWVSLMARLLEIAGGGHAIALPVENGEVVLAVASETRWSRIWR